jgi:hypothetical protein
MEKSRLKNFLPTWTNFEVVWLAAFVLVGTVLKA